MKLSLFVVIVTCSLTSSLAAIVGVLPGSTGVTGSGVRFSGGPPVYGAAGPGISTVLKPPRVPVIPQYARTFGTFSGSYSGYIRDQWETRDGSYVRGGYTLVDVDGSFLLVEYSSDPINGFRVIVKRSGLPDYFLDSITLGGVLPGGFLPPFYSDFGFDFSDDFYGYDFDSYYNGIVSDIVPTYYDSYDFGYDSYAPSFLDRYDFDSDFDTFRRRRRRNAVYPKQTRQIRK